MSRRVFVFVALFATLGGAFRHNLVDITKHLGGIKKRAGVAPPDVSVLSTHVQAVIDAKIEAATAAQQAAMNALMALGSAQVGVGGDGSRDNNTVKRNTTHDMVANVHAANVAKKLAEDSRAFVQAMIDACQDLFGFVSKFEGAKARTLLEKSEAAANAEGLWEELMSAVVEKEIADLSLLIGKIDAIKEAEAQVQSLDAELQTGASGGVSAAANLIYDFAATLEERQEAISSSGHFGEWEELVSGSLKDDLDSHTVQGLADAVSHLDAAVAAHTRTLQAAFSQLETLGGSTNVSNKTAMDDLIQQQFLVNIQKQKAEALHRAVEHCIELINAFFAFFRGYKSEYPIKIAAAHANANKITEERDQLHAAADASELEEASGAFHFYQVMWTRYAEASAAMPSDDVDYDPLKTSMLSVATSVHEWLNNEFYYLCEYYYVEESHEHNWCQGARAALIGLLEKDNLWCDERFNEAICTTTKGGRQPNGKMCKWIKTTDEEFLGGGKPYCKQNNPPTNKLLWGRDHAEGAGIFY